MSNTIYRQKYRLGFYYNSRVRSKAIAQKRASAPNRNRAHNRFRNRVAEIFGFAQGRVWTRCSLPYVTCSPRAVVLRVETGHRTEL